MGRTIGQAGTELLAFHAAMVRLQSERGTTGQIIATPEWEGAMCKALSSNGTLMTRQSCQDKTWFLERLGLITRRHREGVILHPQQSVTDAQQQPA